ncbi:fibronectin type III domain-containing protein (plasmid) [Paenibacillus polymyxa]|uniref:fibronectin type III domain-containing protein n=1 Tax=Paenibacillus polymyxa TaxID=1406 RepID=UPI003B5A0318
MKSGFTKKFGILFGVLLFVMVTFLNSSSYAATLGQNLYTYEKGWHRYDDAHKFIKYHGSWYLFKDGIKLSDGAIHQTRDTDAYISFSFKGTQLRILSDNWDSKTKRAVISIDGNVEYFSEYSKTAGQTLVYEKKSLTNAIHEVVIKLESADGLLNLDAIDINEDGMLVDNEASIKLNATGNDSQATLNWDQVQDAESYTVRYGTESGKYTETVTATKDTYGNFVIPGLTNGTKYYFIVSAKVNGVDSEYSNEASATPQGGGGQPDPEPTTGERAILVVTMTTGLEKEFDLSMKEVKDFISWYESKQAGSGSASFAINKHDNNKGPFSNRKDYMLYDRILTFEVSEYSN